MQQFFTRYASNISKATDEAAHKLGIPLGSFEYTQGRKSFTNIMAFLNVERGCVSSIKDEFASPNFFSKAANRYFKGRFRRELPRSPRTVADDMVGYIMQVAFSYTPEEAVSLSIAHQRAMAAENAVGDVLERYIASVLEPKGWTWCSGTLVTAIDFIRYDPAVQDWDVLQVKNRDNSENSSSAGYRSGKGIPSWFRTFSRTGQTNWPAFPYLVGNDKKLLNEDGFKDFVRAFYAPLKAVDAPLLR